MKSTVLLRLQNGLGDRLLDMISFCLMCHILHYELNVEFETDLFKTWGIYDKRLFAFSNDISIVDKTDGSNDDDKSYKAYMGTYCPYRVYEFLKQYIPKISFKEIACKYREVATRFIQPSSIILQHLPSGLESTYGIHLRCSDRVKSMTLTDRQSRFITSLDELEVICQALFEHIGIIIQNDASAKFLLVSENDKWKHHIEKRLKAIYPEIVFVTIDYGDGPTYYSNFESVLDFFSLSRCKCILQGIKSSSFSRCAALICNKPLINYGYKLPNARFHESNLWKSVVSINGEPYDYDETYQREIYGYTLPVQMDISIS